MFRTNRLTLHIAEAASLFADVCESLKDPIYSDFSMLDLALMTRPPTSFDVQIRLADAGRSPSDGIRVTNGLRGTNYSANAARGVPGEFMDVTTPFETLFGLSDTTLLLGNLRSDTEWFSAAAKGHPELGHKRLSRLATVVNLAIKKARGKNLPVLVLPELSVPREWLRRLVARLLSDGSALYWALSTGEQTTESSTTPSP